MAYPKAFVETVQTMFQDKQQKINKYTITQLERDLHRVVEQNKQWKSTIKKIPTQKTIRNWIQQIPLSESNSNDNHVVLSDSTIQSLLQGVIVALLQRIRCTLLAVTKEPDPEGILSQEEIRANALGENNLIRLFNDLMKHQDPSVRSRISAEASWGNTTISSNQTLMDLIRVQERQLCQIFPNLEPLVAHSPIDTNEAGTQEKVHG